MNGYFPLLIFYVESGEQSVVNSPEEIRKGVTFTVLECIWRG